MADAVPLQSAPDVDADSREYVSADSADDRTVPGSAEAALVKQSQIFTVMGADQADFIGAFINGKPTAPRERPQLPPELPEVLATGYRRNAAGAPEAYEAVLVRVGNVLMEKTTGYDFILMRAAAMREAKLLLVANSCFRTWEDQLRLYNERKLHPELGGAAPPGVSGHQQGRSVDIRTGIGFEDWRTGRVTSSPVRDWLVANAARFGFRQDEPRDLGKLADGRPYEPWHWTHRDESKIFGIDDPDSGVTAAFDDLAQASSDAAYTTPGASDLLRLVLKVGSDTVTAVSRSAATYTSSRDSLLAAAAAHKVYQSGELHRKATRQTAALGMTKPKGFTGKPPLYDFETGTWTDGLGV